MRKLFFAFLALALGGCAALEPVSDRFADVIIRYCQEPQTTRSIARAKVNEKIAPYGHEIKLTCAGDP